MNDETAKVIPFSGKAVDWPVWNEKFLARARRKGHKKISLGKDIVPDDTVNLNAIVDKNEKKEKKKLRKLNEDACKDLILSANGETEVGRVVFQLV